MTINFLSPEIKPDSIPDDLLSGFPSVDAIVELPGSGLTLVGARPRQGRSVFLMNLLLRITQANPASSVVYISFEDWAMKIATKLLNITCDTLVDEDNPAGNLQKLEDLIKFGEKIPEALQTRINSFNSLILERRLFIIESPDFIEDAIEKIKEIGSSTEQVVLMIDSIHQVNLRSEFANKFLRLEAAASLLRETALRLKIPVIAGFSLPSEFRSKKEIDLNRALIESFEKDASMIMCLWNESRQKEEDSKKPSSGIKTDFEIMVLKNRNGPSPVEFLFRLNRQTFALYDPKDPPPTAAPAISTNSISKKSKRIRQSIHKAIVLPCVNT
ncbi:MAG: hypothetical protein HQM10_16695 [Candidatus Riflebacteria bacterium]|nr:hypothetical protein [Candidatus Riflebacteria bacterium]